MNSHIVEALNRGMINKQIIEIIGVFCNKPVINIL